MTRNCCRATTHWTSALRGELDRLCEKFPEVRREVLSVALMSGFTKGYEEGVADTMMSLAPARSVLDVTDEDRAKRALQGIFGPYGPGPHCRPLKQDEGDWPG